MDSALGYDRLAASYQRIEWLVFGRQLQRARVALVDQIPSWQRLLLLGDGDGRLLEQLYVYRQAGAQHGPLLNQSSPASTHPSSHQPVGAQAGSWSITSVGHSLGMLRRQRSRLAASRGTQESTGAPEGTVQFVHTDALTYTPEGHAYDVVVTPFFLDCFSHRELTQRLPIWLSALRTDGVYLHVDFISPRSAWQRPRARLLLWAMHAFFRWQTGLVNRQLVDPRPIIQQSGLRQVTERISGRGMIAAQLWRFDRSCSANR